MTLKQEIINKVAEMCKLGGVPVLVPSFDLTGKVAGRFSFRGTEFSMHFNLPMAEANPEFIDRTPQHEVAHYIRYIRAGYKMDKIGERRDMHGSKWKAVMKELGATDITRCHSYTVPNCKTYRKFAYQCECGQTYELTAIRHNRLVKNSTRYICHQCSGKLEFTGETK